MQLNNSITTEKGQVNLVKVMIQINANEQCYSGSQLTWTPRGYAKCLYYPVSVLSMLILEKIVYQLLIYWGKQNCP